ncbi:UDP-N-acetylmuramate dehydrogenase [Pseudoflavitalea sp. X16]|uniref:UDP-N-acetylmuramate dehydrogenase n=1 Tax=Paraflavitalea devenefica TaxID=2716334 RepID=UPI001421336F|nr:UDP-N-acetylmuramate dehydrogenase [Paraflavitalea devenefica]NII28900.1 UDP-N-acetylmuramate dehydrogenase [Paraflavitalea devenefica]
MKTFTNFDLTNYNSYRVKATCAIAYFPESDNDLQVLYQDKKQEEKILLGSGHNVIMSKKHYEESFVIFSGNYDKVTVNGTTIEAQAGTTMLHLSELAWQHGLAGLEIFYDIPSSLGGAVVMNAGASGEEIKDLLVSVKYYDPAANEFHEISKADISFEYRNSFFQRNPHLIVLSAKLVLKPGEQAAIKQKMEDIKASRWQKQPKDFPNAGSVFKRPPGHFVGPIMEQLGLKGYAVGDAQISKKHGGFIVNTGNATGKDIIQLITDVQEKVKTAFNLHLEIEQRIL